MHDRDPEPDRHVLLGSVSGEVVTFATALLSEGILKHSVRTYESRTSLTFTDALQNYTRQALLSLDDLQLILSVAGAIRGDAIRVTNGRWFISLSGLRSMLRRPPVVLNDVSAVAWSTLMLDPRDLRALNGMTANDLGRAKDRAVIWLGDGLGAGCLAHGDDGRVAVLDGEAGHMTCPSETSEQQEWLEPLRAKYGHLSYERALGCLADEARDRSVPSAKREGAQSIRTAILGGFAGSVALAYGAWGGVYLAGPEIPAIVGSGPQHQLFLSRFAAKGRFRSALSAVPIWTISRDHLQILGALACFRSHAESVRAS